MALDTELSTAILNYMLWWGVNAGGQKRYFAEVILEVSRMGQECHETRDLRGGIWDWSAGCRRFHGLTSNRRPMIG
ncbi:MAG: hypothetical protein ACKVX9_15590 [Blastocatellia bacterium]